MLGYSRWQLFKRLAAAVGIVSIVSLALIYFIPAPPSKVTMATAFKGSSFEYYGQQYREIFARFKVDLELRPTTGTGKYQASAGSKIGRSDFFDAQWYFGWEACARIVVIRNCIQQSILDLLLLE